MKLGNLASVAIRSIMKNRMRSFLTMLGIIIGVASVITLMSVGAGTEQSITSEIEALGTNLLIVSPGTGESGGIRMGAGSLNTLTMGDVKRLREDASYVKSVSPVITVRAQIIAGRKNWATQINGVAPEYLEIRSLEISDGAFFTEKDVRSRSKIAILGKTVSNELFPEGVVVGQKIRVGNVPFTVIGLLEEKGQNMMGQDQDDVVLVPSNTALYRLGDGETVGTLMASAVSEEVMDAAKGEVTDLIRDEHRLKTGEDDDFEVQSQTEILDTMSSITGTLTLFLGAIAGVSLLVGGIGIMNIMLVSVTERTREIGIRLAIGAREEDILVQFLIEAVLVSLLGGILGIVTGLGAGILIGKAIGMAVVVEVSTIALAFTFSGAVGMFFGFFPARKAAALNPIEALHYE